MSDRFQSIDEFESYIRNKSVEDQEFRARLLSNPRDVVEDELDITVPEGFNINVYEDTSTSMHFVLPPSAALSDHEMSALAGGNWCSPV